jgi:hypothetical protein
MAGDRGNAVHLFASGWCCAAQAFRMQANKAHHDEIDHCQQESLREAVNGSGYDGIGIIVTIFVQKK